LIIKTLGLIWIGGIKLDKDRQEVIETDNSLGSKQRYTSPRLESFGSVVLNTGGTGTNVTDGGGTMDGMVPMA
jgi:hypothetical protein